MNYALQALMYFPYVLQSIVAVEAAAKSLPGASKLQLVLNSIAAVAGVSGQLPNDTVKIISTIATAIVTDLNNSGIFTHAAPTPVTTNTIIAVK